MSDKRRPLALISHCKWSHTDYLVALQQYTSADFQVRRAAFNRCDGSPEERAGQPANGEKAFNASHQIPGLAEAGAFLTVCKTLGPWADYPEPESASANEDD